MTTIYIVQVSDIGKTGYNTVKTMCKCCGEVKVTNPFEPLGRVLPQDVGKMMKMVNGLWYVENEEQFRKRKSFLNL